MNSYTVNRERWAKMSIFEQMGNIYSEVGRSFVAQKSANSERSTAALIRALDLFDATVSCTVAQKSPRTKEILRAKDQYLNAYFSNDDTAKQSVEKYFMQFALAARNTRT